MGLISRMLELVGLQAGTYDFIPSLEGAWAPNNRLEQATATFQPAAPADALAVARDGAVLVTSGNSLYRLGGGTPVRIGHFSSELTALHAAADGAIWIAVEASGLVKLDAGGQMLATIAPAAGMPLTCVTAIAAQADGTLVVTTGSDRHPAAAWVHDLMEQGRSGRIIAIGKDGGGTVLADGLTWPAGIVVDAQGRLCVASAWDHCIRRYSGEGRLLDSPLPNLAGYPGRLMSDDRGHHWLSVFAMRTQLIDFVLREPAFRKDMMQSVDPRYWIRPALASEDSYLEPVQGGSIKKLGITKAWAPPRSYGLVVEFDGDFQPLRSFHSRVGGCNHGVTAAVRHEGRLLAVARGRGALLDLDLEEKA